MRIISLKIVANQLVISGDNDKVFEFEESANIVYSAGNNSVGKTTLLRFLMYALGYPIPNTRGIRFAKSRKSNRKYSLFHRSTIAWAVEQVKR